MQARTLMVTTSVLLGMLLLTAIKMTIISYHDYHHDVDGDQYDDDFDYDNHDDHDGSGSDD